MTQDFPKPPSPTSGNLRRALPVRCLRGQIMEKQATLGRDGCVVKAVITGGDSGIGRAVAIAFAREERTCSYRT